MQPLRDELKEVMKQDERLVIDGNLAKNKIVELALKLDKDLLRLLLENDRLKEHFFQDVDGTFVFDRQTFQKFISNKEFLPDSYTAFKNKIGLSANGEDYFIESNDVSLIWPYKDCVLEGGQTKEDSKRDEIFWNETLAPDQIDRLLDSKALTNFRKFDESGGQTLETFSIDDNYVIKGNNLLALHSLKKVYTGKVKLIYIDPPYNTGKDGFDYNDRFNHSSWLTFMKNRLEIARKLLTKNGSIFIQITDNEQAYLRVLLDEIFGRENFVAQITWKKRGGAPNDRQIGATHEYIILYAKDINSIELNRRARSKDQLSRYSNPDNHPKGPWAPDNLMANVKGGRYVESLYFPIENPNTGKKHFPSSNGNWRYNKERIEELLENDEIYFGVDGEGRPKLKRFLCDVQDGVPYDTIWSEDLPTGVSGTNEIKNLFGSTNEFDTPKPEGLMKEVLELGTNEGDLVIDFFAGSGTTGAVAHKMNRQYILCEQMDYIKPVTLKRLQKVIEGEQGGISEEVEWEGGGSFIYGELMAFNAQHIDQIENTDSKETLQEVWEQMKENAFLSYKIDPNDINEEKEAFDELNLEEQKQFLIEVLDKNQLYVNYSEIEDKDYDISEEVQSLNHQFYSMKS